MRIFRVPAPQMRRSRERHRRDRGQTLLEFGLALPLLLLLLGGCVDLGRYIYIRGQVTNNALTAAQAAALPQNDSTDCTVLTDAEYSPGGFAITQDGASVVGDSIGGYTPLVGSNVGTAYIFPAAAQSTSNCVGTASRQGANTSVTVQITYNFTGIMPVINRVLGTLVITASSTVPLPTGY